MRRASSRQKRQLILDAAARAIALHGFHGMSMRELARETGQALASFYNYFASKEEVLLEIQLVAFEMLIANAQAALEGVTEPEQKLLAFIEQHVHYVAQHPDVMRVLVCEAGTLPPLGRSRVRRLKEGYYDLGRRIVAEVHGLGPDLEAATYGIFGMLNWTYGWYTPNRHGAPHDVARSLHKLALTGLTP
ncbi:MAG TPA: TetR/AcrR family transcriptional regulator [Myxococcales bacterium]|nr:TetR/AcrR family transcriptional regulator [Myxococcales bacterium]